MKKFVSGMALVALLGGCEVPVIVAANQNDGKMTGMFEVTLPAMLLIEAAGEEQQLLSGELIGHMNGSAKFNLTGPTWGDCEGQSTKSGYTSMTCENGMAYAFEAGQQKAKMSGINVTRGVREGHPFVAVFGWGKEANEAAVRAAISG